MIFVRSNISGDETAESILEDSSESSESSDESEDEEIPTAEESEEEEEAQGPDNQTRKDLNKAVEMGDSEKLKDLLSSAPSELEVNVFLLVDFYEGFTNS